jgi:hypothetical protein
LGISTFEFLDRKSILASGMTDTSGGGKRRHHWIRPLQGGIANEVGKLPRARLGMRQGQYRDEMVLNIVGLEGSIIVDTMLDNITGRLKLAIGAVAVKYASAEN